MNKVFKVIWSEARNAYVVVSEIAKNHGSKSCSTKKTVGNADCYRCNDLCKRSTGNGG